MGDTRRSGSKREGTSDEKDELRSLKAFAIELRKKTKAWRRQLRVRDAIQVYEKLYLLS